jgi:hypothetical protein
LKFFVDNCISPTFAEFLKAHGVDVVHLTDDFQPGTLDPIWIPKVCKQGRIILTCDKAQLKTKGKTVVELALIQKHRGRGFFFGNGFPMWSKWQQTACFFRAWEKIYNDIAPKMMLGELYAVNAEGKITQKHVRKVN